MSVSDPQVSNPKIHGKEPKASLDRTSVLDTLSDNAEQLKRLGASRLSLFGSVARGEGDNRSDVDLLVTLTSPSTFDKYASLANYLDDLLGRKVDLITMDAVKPFFMKLIEEDLVHVPGL